LFNIIHLLVQLPLCLDSNLVLLTIASEGIGIVNNVNPIIKQVVNGPEGMRDDIGSKNGFQIYGQITKR
jgi:hypothetical protein